MVRRGYYFSLVDLTDLLLDRVIGVIYILSRKMKLKILSGLKIFTVFLIFGRHGSNRFL